MLGTPCYRCCQDGNTRHDGSLSTGHANSPADAISRIEVMTLMGAEEMPLKAIRQQVASGIDIIVQLGRLRDKSRRVLEISEIDSFTDGEKSGKLLKIDRRILRMEENEKIREKRRLNHVRTFKIC